MLRCHRCAAGISCNQNDSDLKAIKFALTIVCKHYLTWLQRTQITGKIVDNSSKFSLYLAGSRYYSRHTMRWYMYLNRQKYTTMDKWNIPMLLLVSSSILMIRSEGWLTLQDNIKAFYIFPCTAFQHSYYFFLCKPMNFYIWQKNNKNPFCRFVCAEFFFTVCLNQSLSNIPAHIHSLHKHGL